MLARLSGDWAFRRLVFEGAAAGMPSASVEGMLSMQPDGNGGLVAEESGTLRLGEGGTFAARRRTLWSVAAGQIALRFEDGRPFHDFDPALPQPRARHLCPPDLYRVSYDFTRWPLWLQAWRVRGPRKDQRIRSLFARDAAVLADRAHLLQNENDIWQLTRWENEDDG